MKLSIRTPQVCMGAVFVLVLGAFAFVACNWLSYCPPTAAVKFAFSGEWFTERFSFGCAGCALDQPSIGKFFLWTSVMSYLACTMVLLLHAAVPADRRAARRGVYAGAILLLMLVLVEFLAPTFMLVQYVLSMGMTIRRFLGLCLCCGFWLLLPSTLIWIRKANPAVTKWGRSPIAWALACSLVAPAYYSSGMLRFDVWRHLSIWHGVFVLAWVVLLAPIPCFMWLRAWGNRASATHDMEKHQTKSPTVP
ncbi:MAG: hypothetical protein PHR35_15475 [Kiritimatiellae bacterium]|nr:hypothetical protein [Kiritimatiellia bacterium]